MARKPKAFSVWKEMKPASLWRLALAVFLMFGVLGPISILMESELRPITWGFVVIQTIVAGGLASSIVLFARKRWWITVFIVMFWSGVLAMNSGGLNFVFNEEGFRVHLGSAAKIGSTTENKPTSTKPEVRIVQPEELDTIYTQRGIIGTIAILLVASGYVSFIKVMRREVRQRARLETEVKIAQNIQQSLLPSSVFENNWCRIQGRTIPATEVGGDYFDIIQVSDNIIAVAIADVAGHGVASGILSAMTKSALHLQLGHDQSPAKVLVHLNTTICQVSDKKMFVTFGYVLLNKKEQTAQLATAGHPPIMFRSHKSGSVEEFRTTNLGLGLKPQATFSEMTCSFAPGDALLLYTDGIFEAANNKGEQFGRERLMKLFSDTSTGSEIISPVLNSVQMFSGSSEQKDDVTVVSIEL